jgi:replicative DNA helicase
MKEAEQSVICSVLLDPASYADASMLVPGDFADSRHATIWQSIQACAASGTPEIVGLLADLRRRGALEDAGGTKYLATLSESPAYPARMEVYARMVVKRSTKARIKQAGETIAEKAETVDDPAQLVAEAQQLISDASDRAITKEPTNAYSALKEWWGVYHDRMSAGKKGSTTGLSTGLIDLDDKIDGMHPGELIIVAGRPGMGKSTFALNLIRKACVENNARAMVFTLEMTTQEIVRNLMVACAGCNAEKMRKMEPSGQDLDTSIAATDRIAQARILIDDTPGISIPDMRAKIRKASRQGGVDLVILDYLQLATTGMSTRGISREQEVSLISRSLKAIAKEFSLPVVALAQLSRKPEARRDMRPMLSDLRDSGSIEQDADVVLFIHRQEYYDGANSDDAGTADVMIAKQRHGPMGCVAKVSFTGGMLRFDNLARGYGGPI